ncbi:hypothetical protein R1flu_019693 [Riccia fluitans]|uniref:FAD-binding domain-containing protein n=1 Tax=Riccia fluitans TaxID=41844 RepID=A0ABD1ZJQ8_9MARC
MGSNPTRERLRRSVSQNFSVRNRVESHSKLSSSFCSSSGEISWLRTNKFKRGGKLQPGSFSRKQERLVMRIQAISTDNRDTGVQVVDDTSQVHELVIVGAGLAGLAIAGAMHKIGVKSTILEQSPTVRSTGAALTVWRNAWRVLDVLGVGEQLRPTHTLLTGVRLRNLEGEMIRSFELDECPGGPHESRGVERKVLVEALASILPKGTIQFNSRVVSIRRESEGGPFQLTLSDGSVIRTKILVGADGVNSVVGKWMGLAPARYAGYLGVRGLAEYPDGHPFEYALMQYCGSGIRIGVVPISQTKVFWFFVYNKANPGPKITDPKVVKEELLGQLKDRPEILRDMLERTSLETLSRGPIMDRWNLPGRASLVQSCVTVAGDAFHPTTPNLGQGGCCALEDSLALARTLGALLSEGGSPDAQRVTKALEEYATERNQRTLAVTLKSFILGFMLMIALRPFVYFRDKFLLPKAFGPTTYLTQTLYDPGQLPVTQAVAK